MLWINWPHQLYEVYHLIISFRPSKYMEISYGFNEYILGYTRFLVLPENMPHMWLTAGDKPKLDLLVKSFKQNWLRLSRDLIYEWLAGGGVKLAQILHIGHSNVQCIVSYTVYPKKSAHGFCFVVLCCGYTLTDFPISIMLTSLVLWQSNDCPIASKATLMNMDKYFMWIHYERLRNHNKAKHNKTVCIFLGIYCTCHLQDYFKMNGELTTLALASKFDWCVLCFLQLIDRVVK